MKQKYSLIRDDDASRLIVREYGELDKDVLSLLCEESFPRDTVAAAMEQGRAALVAALRTNNMYPPGPYAERIAETVVSLYGEEGGQTADLEFDDREFLAQYQEEREVRETDEEEEEEGIGSEEEDSEDLDDLLDDDDGENIKKGGVRLDEEDEE
jgi:hypothetical protein